jgi:hypothetical protein
MELVDVTPSPSGEAFGAMDREGAGRGGTARMRRGWHREADSCGQLSARHIDSIAVRMIATEVLGGWKSSVWRNDERQDNDETRYPAEELAQIAVEARVKAHAESEAARWSGVVAELEAAADPGAGATVGDAGEASEHE